MGPLFEKRTEQRERPALRGPAVIVGSDCIDALIVNASSAGLMIEVPASAVVPSSFVLAIGDYRQDCDLIWRNGTLLGARLSD
jgi:hypothetical protein